MSNDQIYKTQTELAECMAALRIATSNAVLAFDAFCHAVAQVTEEPDPDAPIGYRVTDPAKPYGIGNRKPREKREPADLDRVTEIADRIVAKLTESPAWRTAGQVGKLLGDVDGADVSRALLTLDKSGKIKSSGARRGKRYAALETPMEAEPQAGLP